MIARTKEIYRDACRRSHRILGNYLALWAWKKRADCIVLDRAQLLPYLGLEAMREQRLSWLAEDLKDMFPYQESLTSKNSRSHAGLYLSRVKFPNGVFEKVMYDEERVKLLAQEGVRAILGRLPTEERMVGTLAIAATGGGRRRRKSRR